MTAGRPAKLRAWTSNRPWSLPGIHETSAPYRRFRDLCETFASEFGHGAELTEAQRVVIRNAAMAAFAAEAMQTRLVNGEAVDPDMVVRLAGASARAIDTMREQMPAAPTQPSLAEQLRAERRQAALA